MAAEEPGAMYLAVRIDDPGLAAKARAVLDGSGSGTDMDDAWVQALGLAPGTMVSLRPPAPSDRVVVAPRRRRAAKRARTEAGPPARPPPALRRTAKLSTTAATAKLSSSSELFR